MSYPDQSLAVVKFPKHFLSYVLSLIGVKRVPAAVDSDLSGASISSTSSSSISSAFTTISHSSTFASSHNPTTDDDGLDSNRPKAVLPFTTDNYHPQMSLAWVQAYTKSLVQLDDHLRPTDRFSQTHTITATLHKLVRRCTDHFTDHTALLALLSIADHCLATPSHELCQHLFYKAKLGRLLVLEMTSVVKRTPLTAIDTTDDWIVLLERVCAALAKLDPTWVHVADYQWLVDHVKFL